MPEKATLKNLADQIVTNNDIDACVIVCPKGDGGSMALSWPLPPAGSVNVYEGTEVLWKDLARIIGAGADPVIMPRNEIKTIVDESNAVNQALGDLLTVADRLLNTFADNVDFDQFPVCKSVIDQLRAQVNKGFPKCASPSSTMNTRTSHGSNSPTT